MKKKISRQDLIELRKREMLKKELEAEVGRDLRISYDKLNRFDKLREGKNPYVIHAINFIGTLIIFYVPYLAFSLYIDYRPFAWVMQLGFWLMAFWSLIAKQTIFDYLLKNHN